MFSITNKFDLFLAGLTSKCHDLQNRNIAFNAECNLFFLGFSENNSVIGIDSNT